MGSWKSMMPSDEVVFVPGPPRRSFDLGLAAALCGPGPERPTARHNVTECCQCGATIGPGRDGRKCKPCRAGVGGASK